VPRGRYTSFMSNVTELLERFRRGPELLAVVLTGVFGEEEDFTAVEGEWSIRQIAAHLADSELVGGYRFRQLIAEDTPTLHAYDQEAWAHRLSFWNRKPKSSLESFRRLRAENWELLRALPEEAFERPGNHSEKGPVTLRAMLEIYARHAEKHAAQIQRLRDAYRDGKSRAARQ
jgi:hypothetical protein